jgi:hypothetical protein
MRNFEEGGEEGGQEGGRRRNTFEITEEINSPTVSRSQSITIECPSSAGISTVIFTEFGIQEREEGG